MTAATLWTAFVPADERTALARSGDDEHARTNAYTQILSDHLEASLCKHRVRDWPFGHMTRLEPVLVQVDGDCHHGVPLEHTMRERRSGPGRDQNMAAFVLAGSEYKGKLRAIYNRRLYCMKQALGPEACFNVGVFPLSGLHSPAYTGLGPGRGPSGGLHGPCGRRQ